MSQAIKDHADGSMTGGATHFDRLETLPTIGEGQAVNGSANATRGRGHSDLDGNGHPLYPGATTRSTAASTGHSSKLVGVRSALGLHAQAPVDADHDQAVHTTYAWPRIRLALREPFAEFWGVFIMVMFGNGSVAQVLLSERQTTAPGGDGFGNYQSISWGWGLGGEHPFILSPFVTTSLTILQSC